MIRLQRYQPTVGATWASRWQGVRIRKSSVRYRSAIPDWSVSIRYEETWLEFHAKEVMVFCHPKFYPQEGKFST